MQLQGGTPSPDGEKERPALPKRQKRLSKPLLEMPGNGLGMVCLICYDAFSFWVRPSAATSSNARYYRRMSGLIQIMLEQGLSH
jgi:hypothetical protein